MPDGSWEPSSALLEQVENALKLALPAASIGRGGMPMWNTYTFQYRGERSVLLHRFVAINAFCDGPANHPNWRRDWVFVYDGGACFFSAKFAPGSGRLYDLEVNGIG